MDKKHLREIATQVYWDERKANMVNNQQLAVRMFIRGIEYILGKQL